MAENGKISGLSAISGIDRTADLFEVTDVSLGASKSVTVNAMLGITGAPIGSTDVQAVSNKTIGITNTITVLDTTFTIQDNADTTKQAQFQLSGLTTGTTRTYTLPNASGTLMDLASAQTATNKTFTSPTINTPTINNPSLNTDSISQFTVGNGVTVSGLNIKSGALNTANSVVTSNITDANVTPAKLVAGTGTGWAWQTYSPTLTNITIGNGTVIARYIQTGKLVTARVSIVFGSTSAMGSTPQISIPVAAHAGYLAGAESYGTVQILHTASFVAPGLSVVVDANNVQAFAIIASGTYAQYQQITSLIPFTWGAGDALYFYLQYEAA